MTNEIPRWKVQAALRLLGIDLDGTTYGVEIRLTNGSQVVKMGSEIDYFPIVDTVEDTRVHVLGIDPETGNAELNPVPDNDVTFFAGANMYLHSGTKYSNGTKAPIFKRRA
jgi:hypothetical protein